VSGNQFFGSSHAYLDLSDVLIIHIVWVGLALLALVLADGQFDFDASATLFGICIRRLGILGRHRFGGAPASGCDTDLLRCSRWFRNLFQRRLLLGVCGGSLFVGPGVVVLFIFLKPRWFASAALPPPFAFTIILLSLRLRWQWCFLIHALFFIGRNRRGGRWHVVSIIVVLVACWFTLAAAPLVAASHRRAARFR